MKLNEIKLFEEKPNFKQIRKELTVLSNQLNNREETHWLPIKNLSLTPDNVVDIPREMLIIKTNQDMGSPKYKNEEAEAQPEISWVLEQVSEFADKYNFPIGIRMLFPNLIDSNVRYHLKKHGFKIYRGKTSNTEAFYTYWRDSKDGKFHNETPIE